MLQGLRALSQITRRTIPVLYNQPLKCMLHCIQTISLSFLKSRIGRNCTRPSENNMKRNISTTPWLPGGKNLFKEKLIEIRENFNLRLKEQYFSS